MTKDNLSSIEAVLAVGATIIKALKEKGMATVFINENAEVEFCPDQEYLLDAFIEEVAIQRLMDNNYTDDQIVSYLKGREARYGNRNEEVK